MKNKILIVDDEAGIRESLKLILEEKYDLTVADKPEECLKILAGDPQIRIVMLDIKMPKINGLEILKQIKKLDPEIKVIMVTGYKVVQIAQEALKLGACEYIIKPFASRDVLDAVQKCLPG
jgi:DNA-binding NtrC family response regulator